MCMQILMTVHSNFLTWSIQKNKNKKKAAPSSSQTSSSFDLLTEPRPEPELLILRHICLLLICILSQLLGEYHLPRGDQRSSACSSLWSSFSPRINICTLPSFLLSPSLIINLQPSSIFLSPPSPRHGKKPWINRAALRLVSDMDANHRGICG